MKISLLDNPKYSCVVECFVTACKASRTHSSIARDALIEHGDHGPLISGIVREHFPDHIKNTLRELARAVAYWSNAAHAARPPGVHRTTIVKIGRLVAKRDGYGFYGPQAD